MTQVSYSNINASSIAPPPPARQARFLSQVMLLMILLTGLQICAGFLTYESTLTFDEAMWEYIGRNWFQHGLIPYSGGVDNKSPLIFAIYGVSDKLFGVNFWFPRLLGICFQSAGLYYTYKIAVRLMSERAGLIALFIYGFSILWHASGGKYVSYTESYAVAFTIMAVYFAISRYRKNACFISGMLAGLGFMFRISVLFGFLALLTYLVSIKKNKVLPCLLGFLTTVFLICTIFGFAGIRLHDLFTFALMDNFGPGSVTDRSFAWKINNFFDHFFFSELVLFFPGLIGYCFIKGRNNIFLLWFIFEFTGLIIPGTFSVPHFKSLLPSLSLMSAFSINELLENHALPVRKAMLLVTICFFPKLTEPWFGLKNLMGPPDKNLEPGNIAWSGQGSDYTKKLLGGWIRSNTPENEKVYIAGFSAIAQAYAERVSPVIYFNATQTALAKKTLFRELDLHKPGMICIPAFPDYVRNVNPDLRNYISQLCGRDYRFKKYVYGYNIYIKNE
jgi:hypothetical protein